MYFINDGPGRVAQWSAQPLRFPRSWVRTRPQPRRTKRVFARCQSGGLNEAKTFKWWINLKNLSWLRRKRGPLTWTTWIQFPPSPTHDTCLLCSAMSGLMRLACLKFIHYIHIFLFLLTRIFVHFNPIKRQAISIRLKSTLKNFNKDLG
jgi:hypothetical protein